jgi:hypothetical protein
MKTNVGGIRLKLGTAVDSQPAAQLPYDQQKTGHVGARVLATRIAAHTVKVLLEGEMLDPASASDQLRNYESNLGKELNIGQCILRFLFPDEGRLAMVLRWLNSQANLHVWEIAHRIPPPEFFYKAHPEILEACKLCGAVIFDAATPSTWARTMESFLARTIPNLRVVGSAVLGSVHALEPCIGPNAMQAE